jgi:hypothetical protein
MIGFGLILVFVVAPILLIIIGLLWFCAGQKVLRSIFGG